MKKKNGFTLVELISVIAVLLVIITITVPSVITMKNNSEKKNQKRVEQLVYTAAENLAEKNRSLIVDKYYVKVKELVYIGFLKKDFDTLNSTIDMNTCIEVTKNADNTLNYKIVEDNKCLKSESEPDSGNPDDKLVDGTFYAYNDDFGDADKLYYTDASGNKVYASSEVGQDQDIDKCTCLDSGNCRTEYCYYYEYDSSKWENDGCTLRNKLTVYKNDTTDNRTISSISADYIRAIYGGSVIYTFNPDYSGTGERFFSMNEEKSPFFYLGNKKWQLIKRNSDGTYKLLSEEIYKDSLSDPDLNEQERMNEVLSEVDDFAISGSYFCNKQVGSYSAGTSDCSYKTDASSIGLLDIYDYNQAYNLDNNITWTNTWKLANKYDNGETIFVDLTCNGAGWVCGTQCCQSIPEAPADTEILGDASTPCPEHYYPLDPGYCRIDDVEILYVSINGTVSHSDDDHPERYAMVIDLENKLTETHKQFTGNGTKTCPFTPISD